MTAIAPNPYRQGDDNVHVSLTDPLVDGELHL